MMPNEQLSVMDPDSAAIIQMITTGQPMPSQIRDRLRAQARKISAELREEFEEMEIAADLIRDVRDE